MYVKSAATVLLIGVSLSSISAKADCPCRGAIAPKVCFTYSQFGHRVDNYSDSKVKVTMYDSGGQIVDRAIIDPKSFYQMQIGVQFDKCDADVPLPGR
jgi:hypothetical protein